MIAESSWAARSQRDIGLAIDFPAVEAVTASAAANPWKYDALHADRNSRFRANQVSVKPLSTKGLLEMGGGYSNVGKMVGSDDPLWCAEHQWIAPFGMRNFRQLG